MAISVFMLPLCVWLALVSHFAVHALPQHTFSAAATITEASPFANLTIHFSANPSSAAAFYITAAAAASISSNNSVLAYDVFYTPEEGPGLSAAFALFSSTKEGVSGALRQVLPPCSDTMSPNGPISTGDKSGTWVVRVVADDLVFESSPGIEFDTTLTLTIQYSNSSVPDHEYAANMTTPVLFADLGFTSSRFDASRTYNLSVAVRSATGAPLEMIESVLVRDGDCPEFAFNSLTPLEYDNEWMFQLPREAIEPSSVNYTITNAQPGQWHVALYGIAPAAPVPLLISYDVKDIGEATSLSSSTSGVFSSPGSVMLLVSLLSVAAVVVVIGGAVLAHFVMRRRRHYHMVE